MPRKKTTDAKEIVAFRLAPALREKAEALATAERRTLSQYIALLVEDGLKTKKVIR